MTSSATAAPPELAGKAQEPRGGPGGTGSERGGGSNRFVRRRKGVLVSAGERRGVFCLVRKHCARPRCHCWLLKGQRTVAKPCGALSGSPGPGPAPRSRAACTRGGRGPPGAGTATPDGAAHGRRARARVPAGNRASPCPGRAPKLRVRPFLVTLRAGVGNGGRRGAFQGRGERGALQGLERPGGGASRGPARPAASGSQVQGSPPYTLWTGKGAGTSAMVKEARRARQTKWQDPQELRGRVGSGEGVNRLPVCFWLCSLFVFHPQEGDPKWYTGVWCWQFLGSVWGVGFSLRWRQPPRDAKKGPDTLIWRKGLERRYSGTSVFECLR